MTHEFIILRKLKLNKMIIEKYSTRLFSDSPVWKDVEEGVLNYSNWDTTVMYDTRFCNAVGDGKIDYVVVENKSGRSAIEVKTVVDASGDADMCEFSDADTETYSKNILAAWHYYFDGEKYDLKMMGAADNVGEGHFNERLDNREYTGIDGTEVSEMLVSSHNQILSYVLEKRKENPA